MTRLKRSLVFLLIIIGGAKGVQAQGVVKKLWNNIFNDTISSSQPKFLAYPTMAYTPETRWEVGVNALYVYYAGRDTTNRLSEINAFSFITMEQQYGLWLDHALYTDRSEWFFLGKARFQRFPLLYFGLGPSVTGEELAKIDAGSISIRERVLRRVKGSFYVGLEMDFQRLSKVTFNPLSDAPFPLPTGLEAYTNFGVGIGLVYDNRHNVLNVREGFFAEGGFLHYGKSWGSDLPFTSYFFDARYFKPVRSNQVWATQAFFSYVDGDAPFNQLALMGGEQIMRGYYLGRYRDQMLLTAQTEYRFLPFGASKRWGAAAFLAAGTVSSAPRTVNLDALKVAGGVGARFLIFPSKDVFTRFDIAFSEDGPAYYLYIGEAF